MVETTYQWSVLSEPGMVLRSGTETWFPGARYEVVRDPGWPVTDCPAWPEGPK